MRNKYSFIIPARNEARTIERVIKSIQKQIIADNQIIVIDDNSIDDTVKIAQSLGALIINYQSPNRNVGEMKNIGAKFATGDYLIFLDGHCILPDEEWLTRVDAVFSRNSDALISGPAIPPPHLGILGNVSNQALLKILISLDDNKSFNGGNSGIRKQLFLDLGGFDEGVNRSEDIILYRKFITKGLIYIYDSDLTVLHLDNKLLTFRGWVKRNFLQGYKCKIRANTIALIELIQLSSFIIAFINQLSGLIINLLLLSIFALPYLRQIKIKNGIFHYILVAFVGSISTWIMNFGRLVRDLTKPFTYL